MNWALEIIQIIVARRWPLASRGREAAERSEGKARHRTPNRDTGILTMPICNINSIIARRRGQWGPGSDSYQTGIVWQKMEIRLPFELHGSSTTHFEAIVEPRRLSS